MRIRQDSFEGDFIPKFYGKAHPGFCNGYPCQIFYPIPLNIIAGLAWSFRMWLRHFKTPLADQVYLKMRAEEAENQLRLLVGILQRGDGKVPENAKIIYKAIASEWGMGDKIRKEG